MSAIGTLQEQYFYYPYGGMVASIGSDPNHYKFNGKERDDESNFDQFGARYYAFGMGRFTSADWAAKPTAVPYANYGNPQSLNLYSFVQNNPTTMGDPDGHCCEDEIDFGVGVLRGIASSVSFGYVGAPRPTDTAASVVGQLTGTGIVGSTGEFTKDAGAGTAVLGLAAEGPSLGTSTTVVAAGGLGVLAGTALEGGAATNAARIVLAPLQSSRVGDFSSGDKNRLDPQNASQNGGQNKCTECGQDVQKVQNQKGQSAPANQLHRHRDPPLSKGGISQSAKNRIVCKDCHIKIHKKPLNP